MHPAVPAVPALLIPATAQHAGKIRFQRAEEDEVFGPSLGALVRLLAARARGGFDGRGRGRGVSEEEVRSGTEWGGP